jgi:hypothetical protein
LYEKQKTLRGRKPLLNDLANGARASHPKPTSNGDAESCAEKKNS